MQAAPSPQEAYRKVEFDARVAGADGPQLVALCYEQLICALGTAIHAHDGRDNLLKSRSLTRAVSAITALQLGISGDDQVAGALHQLYEAARRSILDCAVAFDPETLRTIRNDFADIKHAMLTG